MTSDNTEGQSSQPQDTVGAGTVAREDAGPRVDRARELAEAVAAGDAGRLTREVESLTEALGSRTIIANAVGLLMVSGGITRDDAFDQLRRASQRTNRKLRDIATELVERHELRVLRVGPVGGDGDGVLELLDQAADIVGATQRTPRHVAGHQHHPRARVKPSPDDPAGVDHGAPLE